MYEGSSYEEQPLEFPHSPTRDGSVESNDTRQTWDSGGMMFEDSQRQNSGIGEHQIQQSTLWIRLRITQEPFQRVAVAHLRLTLYLNLRLQHEHPNGTELLLRKPP